jgi:hypothetical protein
LAHFSWDTLYRIYRFIFMTYIPPRKRDISSRLQDVRLSFHSFVRVYTFPMGRGSWPIPGSQCAIASFIALASLYPTVYIHRRSLSPTVTPTPLNGCFDYCLWCLRQGYQSDGGTGLTQSVPILRLCSERQNYILNNTHEFQC